MSDNSTDTDSGNGEQRVIISIDASSDATNDVEQAIRDVGGTVLRTLAPGEDYRQVVAELSDEQADAIEALDPVRYVERDHEATAVGDGGSLTRELTDLADDVGDALAGQEVPWGIERVNATALHDQGITGNGVSVSVADSGIASAHPDLPVEDGRAQTTSDVAPPPWDDDNNHGTHCAGTLAAAHNDIGVLGGAPDVTLWADKVLQDSGRGSYSDISAGITAAAEAGCKVISCSIGGSSPARSLEDALAFARERDAVVICATGNAGASQVSYPARYPESVGVGATTPEDTIADFSNRGEGVDIVAPGVGVKSTVPGGYSETWQGTSMSTPIISACVALLVQAIEEEGL